MISITDKTLWLSEEEIKSLWKEYESSVKEITKITSKSSIILKGTLYGPDVPESK